VFTHHSRFLRKGINDVLKKFIGQSPLRGVAMLPQTFFTDGQTKQK